MQGCAGLPAGAGTRASARQPCPCLPVPPLSRPSRRYFLQYITQSRNTRNRLDAAKELKKLVGGRPGGAALRCAALSWVLGRRRPRVHAARGRRCMRLLTSQPACCPPPALSFPQVFFSNIVVAPLLDDLKVGASCRLRGWRCCWGLLPGAAGPRRGPPPLAPPRLGRQPSGRPAQPLHPRRAPGPRPAQTEEEKRAEAERAEQEKQMMEMMRKAQEDAKKKAAAEAAGEAAPAEAGAAAAAEPASSSGAAEAEGDAAALAAAEAEVKEILGEAAAAADAEDAAAAASTSGGDKIKSLEKAESAAAARAGGERVDGGSVMKSQKDITLAKDLDVRDR